MKDFEEWVNEIESYIDRLHKKNKTDAYYPSAEMTQETAKKLESHFLAKQRYTTSFHRCMQCVNKYDILISWIN